MYEVEVKVRADHDRVRAALAASDASLLGTVRQVDTYYDAPHRDFAATDEALRIRREVTEGVETTTVVTYKGPLVEAESKTREEIETPIDSVEEVDAILSALGFEVASTVEKERERWSLEDYHVTLDDVAGLGEFVEVEATAEAEADIVSVREGALDLLRSLGLDPDAQIGTSYLGLLMSSERTEGDEEDL
ncbi:MAG: class IV adenylate cyclase [Halanaeroarchaeum sp.]